MTTEKSAKPKKNRVACLSITDKHHALSRSLNCFASYQKRDVVCVSEEEKRYRLDFYYDWRVDSESIVNDILSLGENPWLGVQPRYAVLRRQGYLVLITKKDLVFYKVNETEKIVTIYAVVDQRKDYLNIIRGLWGQAP